ncbi:MAG TPA: HEAT repeat domain-containing protein [Aggregatilineales bacterium]|nr:HEAT repeat domain-containing protein [Aggregatilineales bacterium]
MDISLEETLYLLTSPLAHERVLGLQYAGKYRYYDTLEACLNCLIDPDEDVRAYSAWALDQLSKPETIPALLNALNDTSFDVRSHAGWALVHLARRTIPDMILPEVIDILSESDHEGARQMAYLILHNIGGAIAQDAIKRYWK